MRASGTILPRTVRVPAKLLLVAALLSLATIGSGRAQDATPATRSAHPWPVYGHDVFGTRSTSTAGISATNVAALSPAWEVDVGGPVSATPIVAAGIVYVGSYDGALRALALEDGERLWTYETGAAVLEPNLQIDLGITGSAAYDAGTVYVGDATATVHAIDATSGEARWQTLVDQQPNASIWSSPVVWEGTIYVGVASVAKEAGFRGNVVALDATTGDVIWQRHMVPEGADGAGVFAVPALDPRRGLLFVGTQNAYSPNPAPYGNPTSVVALSMETGEIAWAFRAPPTDDQTAPTEDVAFSASPNLFTVEIDGQARDLVGNGQKSGVYWALDRDTGDVVWQTEVAPAGPLGGMEGTAAVAAGLIAVPATDWPDPSGPAAGSVSVLDIADGSIHWTADRGAPMAAPVAIGQDVLLAAGLDGRLVAYAMADGAELWSAELAASVAGGIALADGVVVVPTAAPAFAPFVTPGSTIRAFAVGSGAATPTG